MTDWNMFTLGGEWRQERLKDTTANRDGKDVAEHPALFVQDEVAIGPDWSLTVEFERQLILKAEGVQKSRGYSIRRRYCAA